jgi:hypothetical protein
MRWSARSSGAADRPFARSKSVHEELAPYFAHGPAFDRSGADDPDAVGWLYFGDPFQAAELRRDSGELCLSLVLLGIEDKIPDHPVFSRARQERFRVGDALRGVFEGVVPTCIVAGLVGGEAFSIEAVARGSGHGGSHHSSATGGAAGTSLGSPGTNSAGTALSSGGGGNGAQKGPLGGTNPVVDRDEAKVDKMIKSICRGC